MEILKNERPPRRRLFEGFEKRDVDTLIINTLLTTGGAAALGCEFGKTGIVIATVVALLFFGIGGYRNAVEEICLRKENKSQ